MIDGAIVRKELNNLYQVSWYIYKMYLFLLTDTLHQRLSMRDRSPKDFLLFLPKAQAQGNCCVLWRHHNSTDRLADGWHDSWDVRIPSVIQVWRLNYLLFLNDKRALKCYVTQFLKIFHPSSPINPPPSWSLNITQHPSGHFYLSMFRKVLETRLIPCYCFNRVYIHILNTFK